GVPSPSAGGPGPGGPRTPPAPGAGPGVGTRAPEEEKSAPGLPNPDKTCHDPLPGDGSGGERPDRASAAGTPTDRRMDRATGSRPGAPAPATREENTDPSRSPRHLLPGAPPLVPAPLALHYPHRQAVSGIRGTGLQTGAGTPLRGRRLSLPATVPDRGTGTGLETGATGKSAPSGPERPSGRSFWVMQSAERGKQSRCRVQREMSKS
ncbi:MAG: hypothetical protein JWO38_3759, partial [Gemmataceae bacterium]|nr:hypothetical protein [Gemmataceae bacterium]